MSILRKFKQKVVKYRAEADQRAEKKLARARTAVEREKIMAEIKRERLASKKQTTEAGTALLKAEAARQRAAKEVKDIKGGSGFFSGIGKSLAQLQKSYYGEPKKKAHRRTVKHKAAKRGK